MVVTPGVRLRSWRSDSSATFRSTLPVEVAIISRTRRSSSPAISSPGLRRTHSTTAVRSGAIRSSTGTLSSERAIAGGSSGCAARSSSWRCSGSTTSAASPAYWAVPDAAETAREGHWEPGPGAGVFLAAESALGRLPVIAEDLGLITPDVVDLRDSLDFPGMAVILWAFDEPARESPPPREPSRAAGRVHVDARHRHARRPLPGRVCRGRSSSWPSHPARISRWFRHRTCWSSGARRG